MAVHALAGAEVIALTSPSVHDVLRTPLINK